jgi:glycosyltransferase involved in cell wall biosynthesis
LPQGRELKVLHVVTSIIRGGAETHVVELARGQVNRGASVQVAYLKDEQYWHQALVKAGVEVTCLGMARYGDPRPIVRLRAIMRRFRPDILHAHLPPAELHARLALAVGGPVKAFVISRHLDESFYRGPWHRALGRWVARRADSVIAVSDAVREHSHRYLGISRARTRTIRHGIDLEPFARVTPADTKRLRAEWGAIDDTMVVGTVGRLMPQKALPVLLEGFARYRALCSRPSRLVVVGYGPLETELKARSFELGLADAVVWAGFRDDIPVVMCSFDVFALSSQYEGFGLVLLEAMAAGKPVVATKVSAIPEVVEDGVTGLLVPAKDPDALSAALVKLENVALRNKLGAEGRKRASQFTLDGMIDATLAAYSDALDAHR